MLLVLGTLYYLYSDTWGRDVSFPARRRQGLDDDVSMSRIWFPTNAILMPCDDSVQDHNRTRGSRETRWT